METLDLRDLVAGEVEYRKLDGAIVDKAVRYIKDSDQLMQLLDLVIDRAICRCQ